MEIYTGIPKVANLAAEGRVQEVRDVMQELEGLGVAGLVIPDHIISSGWSVHGRREEIVGNRTFPDPFSMLGFLSAVTTTLKLAPRILIVPYRQPFETAHAFATLDVLSAGRIIFGGAAGYEEVEYKAFGIPIKQRGSRTDEYLRLMTALWEQEKVTFQGRYYSADDVGLLVRPLQRPRPPIWIGGFSHRAVQRAVEFGDWWTPNCYTYPPERPGERNSLSRQQFIEEVAWARAECERLGRPRLRYVLSSGPAITITEKPEHAGRGRYEIQHFSIKGTVEELADEYRVFKDAGADAFYVAFPNGSTQEYLRTARIFMEQIRPALGGVSAGSA